MAMKSLFYPCRNNCRLLNKTNIVALCRTNCEEKVQQAGCVQATLLHKNEPSVAQEKRGDYVNEEGLKNLRLSRVVSDLRKNEE